MCGKEGEEGNRLVMIRKIQIKKGPPPMIAKPRNETEGHKMMKVRTAFDSEKERGKD